jgi:hypothetical protein
MKVKELRERTGKCSSATRAGKRCAKSAGWGTEHPGTGPCKLHGGNTPTVVKGTQVVLAQAAVETYGLPREIDPFTALAEELARTAGHVAWLGQQVAKLEEAEVVGPVGTEGTDAESGLQHHPRGEASVWVRLYQEERKHLTDVASTCIKCGLDAKRVELAQQQGQLLATVIQGVLGELKIDPAKAAPVVRKHLTLVAGEMAA